MEIKHADHVQLTNLPDLFAKKLSCSSAKKADVGKKRFDFCAEAIYFIQKEIYFTAKSVYFASKSIGFAAKSVYFTTKSVCFIASSCCGSDFCHSRGSGNPVFRQKNRFSHNRSQNYSVAVKKTAGRVF